MLTSWHGTQATDYLEQAEYDTGNPKEDLKTQSLMRQIVYNQKLRSACPVPFDEAKLWKGQSGSELKQQIQKQSRNIRFLIKQELFQNTLIVENGFPGKKKLFASQENSFL